MAFQYLSGFTFTGCAVRTKNILGFCAQKEEVDDPFEPTETALFFYYPDKPTERKWAMCGVGSTTGIGLCAAFAPEERWVALTDDGEVYVVGKGEAGWEERVSPTKRFYFSRVRAIRGGHAIGVGVRRKVYRRDAPNQWSRVGAPFPDSDSSGFSDIDGTSESDLYACGDNELWHFDGRTWSRVEVPKTTSLSRICCADDGVMYAIAHRNEVLRGSRNRWEVVRIETNEVLESIVPYAGKVIVSTVSSLFEVSGERVQPADLGDPPLRSKARLAAGDGVLLAAGRNEAAMFDGRKWHSIV